ncbi:FG-GAP repeat domain-containing protein [Desulfosudis oleivorans]|uniref:FG-GAP repeat protein n=1 Tax=Desulfosudis oleivorans (strain DSM 6200 / JCM 39069 / Hxd3) TaxID=96561 RepID=A9A0T3_DESOH|nr:VCBS repeat-containing protein [Desulfosudis oleivorans]ABW67558.1 FG-GAP repeat protein [Desulfosudis oleivorans Hxd3]
MMKHQTLRTDEGKPFPVASCLVKGVAAASMAGLVFAASPAHCDLSAGPFVQQFGANNPLKAPVDVSQYLLIHPSFVDIDGDGDYDMFIGGEGYGDEGEIRFFENTGTAANPGFVERTGSGPGGNPFYGMDVGYGPAPAFADIDGDGDMDAIGGEGDEGFIYFQNTGTASAPAFTAYYPYISVIENPFAFLDPFGTYATPAFVDIDGDGDMDLIFGKYNTGSLGFSENIGTATDPAFNSAVDNPFDLYEGGPYSTPTFADIDNDGDMDAVMGEAEGYLNFFENNTVGGESIDFTKFYPTDTGNPLYGQNPGYYSSPAFVDIDGDGDMDMVVGAYNDYGDDDDDFSDVTASSSAGSLTYYQNVGDADAPAFALRTGAKSPFSGFDVGYLSTPAFVDIDGDGDLDAFSGKLGFDYRSLLRPTLAEETPSVNDGIHFFENTGTASAPTFMDNSDQVDNPFFEVAPGVGSFVAFADIDGDGDMDAFVGGVPTDDFVTVTKFEEGESFETFLRFFENTGTAAAPVMSQRAEEDNPLAAVNSDTTTLPRAIAFVDIDGDGDLDAFVGRKYFEGYEDGEIGEESAPIQFYKNSGTAQDPVFTLDDNDNPLGFVLENTPNSGVYSLAFTDIDGDGDMDAVVGEYRDYIRRAKFSASVVDDDDDTDNSITYYENVGSATAPAFAPVPKVDDLFARMTENSPYMALSPAFADIDGDGDTDIFAGEAMGRFLFIENQTPADDDDDTPAVLPVEDDDTCFVQAARADSNPSFIVRNARRVYDAMTSLFR